MYKIIYQKYIKKIYMLFGWFGVKKPYPETGLRIETPKI